MQPSTSSTPKKGKGKKKQTQDPASPQQKENEQTTTNRLVTRALYDTEEVCTDFFQNFKKTRGSGEPVSLT